MTATAFACLLAAIASVESGGDDARVSAAGARGRYQMMPGTWADRTKLPFAHAHDRATADAVAALHLQWLTQRPELPATPYWLALAWRVGATAAAANRASPHAKEHASRVARLAAAFEREGIPGALLPLSPPLPPPPPKKTPAKG